MARYRANPEARDANPEARDACFTPSLGSTGYGSVPSRSGAGTEARRNTVYGRPPNQYKTVVTVIYCTL